MIEIILWTVAGMLAGFASTITEAGEALSTELREWYRNR